MSDISLIYSHRCWCCQLSVHRAQVTTGTVVTVDLVSDMGESQVSQSTLGLASVRSLDKDTSGSIRIVHIFDLFIFDVQCKNLYKQAERLKSRE